MNIQWVKRRVALVKGIPDIRDLRDLAPRDTLPSDPEDTRDLSEGEKHWIVYIAPLLHRQLLQVLSVSALLAQETTGELKELEDGTCLKLSRSEMSNLCSSLVSLTADSIRTIVDFQRARISGLEASKVLLQPTFSARLFQRRKHREAYS